MISLSTRELQALLKDSLRDLRLSADLTQAQLAEKIGVAKKTLQTWEQYGGPIPNLINTVDYVTACDSLPAVFFLSLFNRLSSKSMNNNQAEEIPVRELESIAEIYLDTAQKQKIAYMVQSPFSSSLPLLVEVAFAFSVLSEKAQHIILYMIYFEVLQANYTAGIEVDTELLKSRLDQLQSHIEKDYQKRRY